MARRQRNCAPEIGLFARLILLFPIPKHYTQYAVIDVYSLVVVLRVELIAARKC